MTAVLDGVFSLQVLAVAKEANTDLGVYKVRREAMQCQARDSWTGVHQSLLLASNSRPQLSRTVTCLVATGCYPPLQSFDPPLQQASTA